MVSPTKRKSLHHTDSRSKKSRSWKSERPPPPRQDDCLPIHRKTRPIPLDQYLKRRRTHDESKEVLAPRTPSPTPRAPSPDPRTPSPTPRAPSPDPRTPSPTLFKRPSTPRTPSPVPICGTPKRSRPLTPRAVLSPSDYVENIPPRTFRSLMTQTVPTLCDFGTQTDPIPLPRVPTSVPRVSKRDAFTQTKKRGGQALKSQHFPYTPRRI
ncbi:PREDICTED: extensin-like [Vollenhovia emeryi]|uniref:extensin-like n=1 Tax=Vollenhovia emeryi TaxID=411798 RepID=UPI0005F3D458|nr:PREDICTED: extensin-like [Vollenhovia emeryi]